nr:accessory recombination function gene [Salmonella phage P22]
MQHEFSDEEFIALISPEIEEEVEQQINLAAERQNPIIEWDEFAGYYS